MQCPTCLLMRSKGSWRPSQWRRERPETEEFKQCKVCDGELVDSGSWSWLPSGPPSKKSRQSSPSPASTPHPPPPCDMPPEGKVLLHIVMNTKRDKFGEFIDLWMDKLSRELRKRLSYSGALRSGSGDPVHYICKHTEQGYFDPSNAIYDMALCFLEPLGLQIRKWNAETRGDICEALLGLSYQLTHKERVDVFEVAQHVHKVAHIIEVTATLTYRLWVKSGSAFKDWCAHILGCIDQEYIDQHAISCMLPRVSLCPTLAPRDKKKFIMNADCLRELSTRACESDVEYILSDEESFY